MKKLTAALAFIIIIPFFFKINVFANKFTSAEEFQTYYNEYFSVNVNNTTQAAYSRFETYAQANPNLQIYVMYRTSPYAYIVGVGNFIDNGTEIRTNGYFQELQLYSSNSTWQTGNGNYKVHDKDGSIVLYSSWEEFNSLGINFDDLYYSAQIPTPSIDVYMGSSVDNPTSGQAVWNASMEFGDNSQYYIQYGYKVSFPSYIDIGLASLRGDYSFNYYNYVSTDYIDIVGMETLTSAVNQSKSAAYFQSGWQDFYDNYLTDSLMPDFGSQVNAMSTAMIDDAKEYYVDYMMTQIPMYGNRLEIFARYFIVDEENDNRVVVGAWNHWNSKDGSRTKERPSNYIDNVALPGNIITNTDPDFQGNSDTYTTNGDSTGTPATIINNNYAPNYPDYPTVATYNHDNILLNFMDTAKQLPSFFGEFTGFLTVAFGFIPSWIWTIIGMGFTFSIVIMIIKVL